MGIKVDDVMTADPGTLPPTATVGDAYQLMRDHGFRHVPVVESGLLLGVISLTDVGHLGAQVPALLAKPLHEVMSKGLVTVAPGTPITAAAAIMASRKINCLLVVVDNQLVGIVTTYDLLDALASRAAEER